MAAKANESTHWTLDIRVPWTEHRGFHFVLGTAFAALLLSRKPDVLLHAELWGDDGWSWYPDAYNIGARSLLLPVNGYFNTLQRLVGLAVQPLPLAWVPTVFAGAALIVQVAPAVFLVSWRMQPVWPNTPARLAFALLYLGLPNEIELYVNLTNAQWNLALLALLVLFSAPPARRAGWIFDGAILLLSGLSGPFCLFLLPVALLRVAGSGTDTNIARAALIGAAALPQTLCLLVSPSTARSSAPLGAGPRMLARIIALQVLLGAELGYRTIAVIYGSPVWQYNIMPLMIAAAGAVIGGVALLRGPPLVRQVALFAGLLLSAALARPQVSLSEPQWRLLAHPPMGNRYFSFPILAWLAVLFTLTADRTRLLKATGIGLLLVMLFWGVPDDWQIPRMPRTDFVARAHAFEAAPPGTRMEFPIVPPGLTPMVLVKRPR